jgi:hypothetical protein
MLGGGRSAPHPGRFTPGKDPVPIVQEAGWAPGPVWTCAKYLAPTRIQSPDHPACSQSLYQLSYPAHPTRWIFMKYDMWILLKNLKKIIKVSFNSDKNNRYVYLSYSQVLATCPYPELTPSSPHDPRWLNYMRYKIILLFQNDACHYVVMASYNIA